jgi:hypothetical protein
MVCGLVESQGRERLPAVEADGTNDILKTVELRDCRRQVDIGFNHNWNCSLDFHTGIIATTEKIAISVVALFSIA